MRSIESIFGDLREIPGRYTRVIARSCEQAAGRVQVGGANRDRTGDLLLAKQALSQLSYGP